MSAEGFFQRWSRLKSEPGAAVADAVPHDPASDLPAPAAPEVADIAPHQLPQQANGEGATVPLPTLEDVAQLHAGSDYSVFMARGVDKSVQRGALKKLFADPHFNIGDGLDLYMGDYNKPDPIPAAMMSALRHTQSFFAQAYPDQKTEEDDPGSTLPPADSPETPVILANMEPYMADIAAAPDAQFAPAAEATPATSEDHA